MAYQTITKHETETRTRLHDHQSKISYFCFYISRYFETQAISFFLLMKIANYLKSLPVQSFKRNITIAIFTDEFRYVVYGVLLLVIYM